MFDPKKMFDMIKNASEMQKNIIEKLKNEKAHGEAGGGMVKVVMNGHFELESVSIEEELLKQNKSFIEDLFKAAVNDAGSQLRGNMANQIRGIMGNLGI